MILEQLISLEFIFTNKLFYWLDTIHDNWAIYLIWYHLICQKQFMPSDIHFAWLSGFIAVIRLLCLNDSNFLTHLSTLNFSKGIISFSEANQIQDPSFIFSDLIYTNWFIHAVLTWFFNCNSLRMVDLIFIRWIHSLYIMDLLNLYSIYF